MCDSNGYSDLATATVVVLPSDLPPVAVAPPMPPTLREDFDAVEGVLITLGGSDPEGVVTQAVIVVPPGYSISCGDNGDRCGHLWQVDFVSGKATTRIDNDECSLSTPCEVTDPLSRVRFIPDVGGSFLFIFRTMGNLLTACFVYRSRPGGAQRRAVRNVPVLGHRRRHAVHTDRGFRARQRRARRSKCHSKGFRRRGFERDTSVDHARHGRRRRRAHRSVLRPTRRVRQARVLPRGGWAKGRADGRGAAAGEQSAGFATGLVRTAHKHHRRRLRLLPPPRVPACDSPDQPDDAAVPAEHVLRVFHVPRGGYSV